MLLELNRFKSTDDWTISILAKVDADRTHAEFMCFCLEDEHRKEKVSAETRIPKVVY